MSDACVSELDAVRDWRELLHKSVVEQVDLVTVELMGLCPRMLFHDATADVVRYQFGEEHSERPAVLPWIALGLSTQISAGRLMLGRYQECVGFATIPYGAVIGAQVVINQPELQGDSLLILQCHLEVALSPSSVHLRYHASPPVGLLSLDDDLGLVDARPR